MIDFSEELDKLKYRQEGETFKDKCARIANALKENDEHFSKLKSILIDKRFLFAGRIQAGVGTARKVTPINCFVMGKIHDSFDGVMQTCLEAGQSMRMGGGVGYDWSTIRPRGSNILSLSSQASGPVSFMSIPDAICKTIASAGQRRGAQMGVLRVDHPDIREFITAKHNNTNLTQFNLSIAVTDNFMHAVEDRKDFSLVFDEKEYARVDAYSLWEEIMRSTYDWGEPGVIFVDAINRENNLWYCEELTTTNPCGEQPLPPYGACLLGSFNLARYLKLTHFPAPIDSEGYLFAWPQFEKDIPLIVLAMDNVIDDALMPLEKQKEEILNKRRIGIGITGYANCVEALGHPYGSATAQAFLKSILRVLRDGCYLASTELARIKGPFPAFSEEKYLAGPFISRLPAETRRRISRYGIRNSHLISIAPTGTISLTADNISSGIEPVWQSSYEREVRGEGRVQLVDYGVKYLNIIPRVVDACSISDHVETLLACSEFVDSNISKTVNVPFETSWQDFKNIYWDIWKGGGKSCSTFTLRGKREGIINVASCQIDKESGIRSCDE